MEANDPHHSTILRRLAHRSMIEHGLLPDFSTQVLAEVDGILGPAAAMNGEVVRDLRHRLWASIDNDDSRDLDQFTVAEVLFGGKAKILIAIADVDAVVKDGSAIDDHARHKRKLPDTAGSTSRTIPTRPRRIGAIPISPHNAS